MIVNSLYRNGLKKVLMFKDEYIIIFIITLKSILFTLQLRWRLILNILVLVQENNIFFYFLFDLMKYIGIERNEKNNSIVRIFYYGMEGTLYSMSYLPNWRKTK
jgi:hypothetical protein